MNIKNNPFNILNVSPWDGRRVVITASEEMSFLLDADLCEKAQNSLINPAKRLSAELDWFIDVDNNTLIRIKNCINQKVPIPTDALTSLSKLNATLFNFSISQEKHYKEMKEAILGIDSLYTEIDQKSVLEVLNQNRAKAKMTEVSLQQISFEFNKKREGIRQVINHRLEMLDNNAYIELITVLAEYIADENYDDGNILSDVLDQYELNSSADIEQSAEEIFSLVNELKVMTANEAISELVDRLISRVIECDKKLQPLQLKSKASGMPHEMSEKIGYEIHELAVDLNNERGQTEAALKLAETMQSVFAELGNLSDLFTTDTYILQGLLESNEEVRKILADMEELEKLSESLKSFTLAMNYNSFISEVIALNQKIKSSILEDDLILKFRERLCYMARGVAIYLHNEKQQTSFALTLAKALSDEFSDIPSLRLKLNEDVSTLDFQQLLKNTTQTRASSQGKSKNIGSIIWWVAVILFVVIFIFSEYGSYDSSDSTSTTKSSSSYSQDNKTYTYNGSTKSELEKEMETLNTQITNMGARLTDMDSDISSMESDLEWLESDLEDYESQYYSTEDEYYRTQYNNTVEEYYYLFEEYSEAIDEYNILYNQYDKAIGRYNEIVEEYNRLN